MIHQCKRSGLNYRDAWTLRYPEGRRAPTCGIHDHAQWPDGADCRDFIFATEDLRERIVRVEVNETTDASDHQPILIELVD
jgi:endonuclease/exonuclease/phosphatase family metal-dependent hydrolase